MPLEGYRIVSFATHGLVREELEGISEPALVLTPTDCLATVDDGLLTATEISQLRLPADLVILSACNSANFDVTLFGPEAAGLSSAFLLAGARTTLASLWSVDSAGTASWMSNFVHDIGRASSTPSNAMRSSIRAFLASQDKRFHHPRYWSSFALFGDGHSPLRPLSSQSPDIRTAVATKVRSLGPSEYMQLVELDSRSSLAAGYAGNRSARVEGALALFRNESLAWEVLDPDFSLSIAHQVGRPSGSMPSVVAWRYAEGVLEAEVRAYSKDGRLVAGVRLNKLDGQVLAGAVSLPTGNVVIGTYGDAQEGRRSIWLQEFSASGNRIRVTSLRSQPEMTTSGVRLFASNNGMWVVIEGRTKRREQTKVASAIGAAIPCETERRADLVNVDAGLQLTGDWRQIPSIVISDIKPGIDHGDVVALTSRSDCAPLRSSVAGLGLLYKGQKSTLHAAPIEGFATEGRTAKQLADGSYVLVSEIHRTLDADMNSRDSSWSLDVFFEYPSRTLKPGRFQGVQLSRFNSKGDRLHSTSIHTGGTLFVTGVAGSGSDLFLVGTSNWHRFAATVVGFMQ